MRLPALESVGNKRIGQAGKVGTSADAPDHDVGILTGHLHLLLGLEADHGLVKEYVVDDGAQRVLGIVMRRGVLHRFGDRDPEAARRVWVGGQDPSSGVGELCR